MAMRAWASVVSVACLALFLSMPVALGEEIAIGASLETARQQLRQGDSKIAVDSDEGLWHILVAQQESRQVNLLFEQGRLRYISYDFHLGIHPPLQGSVAYCDQSFKTAVAQLSADYGTGDFKRVMHWPEREITVTWRGATYFAVARELSDLTDCLLVKTMIFDGNEAAFAAFDQRLKQP